jgi:ketosteroid isomerase-like protein
MDDAIAAMDELLDAFNRRDYAAYEALLTDDVEAFAGVVTPFRFDGKDEWMGFVRGLDAFASVNQERRHTQYRAYNGDTVVSNGYFVFTTTSAGGETHVQSGRESSILVIVDGRWLVANLHFSAMF